MVPMHVFDVKVRYYVSWFGCCEERDACPVAEEAEIAVICDDVNRRAPRQTHCASCTGALVVDGADVAAIEANTWAPMEKGAVCGIG